MLLLRGLCHQRRYLKHAGVTAIVTLSLRPLIAAEFSTRLLTLFVVNILSIPGFVLHIQQISPEVLILYNISIN